jgi:uncharacterized coiled-coil DUF342 family protein
VLLDEAIAANDQLLARLDETLARIRAFRDERAEKAVRLRAARAEVAEVAEVAETVEDRGTPGPARGRTRQGKASDRR